MGNALLRFGDPPQTAHLLPDTGSSETWIFCSSETLNSSIYPSYHDISVSSTFKPIYCSSPACRDLEECASPEDLCRFHLSYTDGTLVRGFWAKETLTLTSEAGEMVKLENFTLGCGFPVKGDVDTATGVLGLSPEATSFASFMNDKLGGASMAHYVPRDGGGDGFLFFGDASRLRETGDGMDYINLLAGREDSSFVGISGVFIGGEKISAPDSIWDFDPETDSGGVILDTGTPLTYVAEEVYEGVLGKYRGYFQELGAPWWEREGDFCFSETSYAAEGFPGMEMEFEGGARLVPFSENLVYEAEEGILCLVVKAANRSEGFIIGSYFLRGLFWVYDPDRRRVGFRA